MVDRALEVQRGVQSNVAANKWMNWLGMWGHVHNEEYKYSLFLWNVHFYLGKLWLKYCELVVLSGLENMCGW